jgi:basic membrane protein A
VTPRFTRPERAPLARRTLAAVAVLAATGLVAACGSTSSGDSAASGSSTASASHADFTACLMASETGIADHSFNEQAWDAMKKAQSTDGIKIKYLSMSGSIGYPQIGAQFVQQGCSLIIGNGFSTTETITKLAQANPKINFAVIDDQPTVKLPNLTGLTYSTDQSSFLGGYLAASMTTTGTVGVYGNEAIQPVELYMTGYVKGVDYFNSQKGKTVKVIGWDPTTKQGQFVGSFTDVNKGKLITEAELQQGADVIFAVAGPIDQGTATAVRAAGGPAKGKYMLWVDADGCVAVPGNCDVVLSTVEKRIDTSLYDVVNKTVNGSFPAGSYVGTLTNSGTGLAPFYNLSSKVPAAVQTELKTLQATVATGKIATS